MVATTAEAAILKRVISPESGDLPREAAQQILKLGFSESDHARMAELSARAQEGTLTDSEREELDAYTNVSHFVALLQSKARTSLKTQSRVFPAE